MQNIKIHERYYAKSEKSKYRTNIFRKREQLKDHEGKGMGI